MGASTDFIGIDAGVRLLSTEAGVKFKIPYTDKKPVISGEGEVFALGFHSYYDGNEHKFKIGFAAIIGGGLGVGIE
ncbi:MAG: hypothetical protein Q4G33_07390 [bacterium]|nr:hypothetical protein [bacterium]